MKKFPNTHRVVAAALGYLLASSGQPHAGEVDLVRVPNGGIQPQAAMDEAGTLHLIYYKGDPHAGDIYYVNRNPGEEAFSQPVRVNSRDGSAIAAGTIRGAHLAIGKNRRVHVSWMGSGKVSRKIPEREHAQHPMLYTRLNDQGTAFEPERNLMIETFDLDGGGSIAADRIGNVYVAWHGSALGNQDGPFGRAVYLAHSKDDGQTFSKERKANPEETGSCPCCGMRAFADSDNNLFLVYRTANESTRDMALLTSSDQGESFSLQTVNQWAIQACPMSSAVFSETQNGILIGTEKRGHIDPYILEKPAMKLQSIGNRDEPSMKGKHPALCRNGNGETLVAWSEGAGWANGGFLRWHIYDSKGYLIDQGGGEDIEVPVWSFATAIAKRDGNFLIVF